ncbi:MAG TPA: M23 family metallopeptidase [Elusimicrobiota bacterium]|nr:M23 family metallopeptidase [Elusimicrobiota bacterium]
MRFASIWPAVVVVAIGICGARPAAAEDVWNAPPNPAADASTPTAPAPAPVEPFVYPLTNHRKMVSGFGPRPVPADPDHPGLPKTEMHEGLDWAVAPNTPVMASRSGKVLFAGFSKMYASRVDKTDQSRLMIIRHDDGKSTRYVHLNTLSVRPGQQVLSGDVIGTTAESDEWKVPVLHFEIRDAGGRALNPAKLLKEPSAP